MSVMEEIEARWIYIFPSEIDSIHGHAAYVQMCYFLAFVPWNTCSLTVAPLPGGQWKNSKWKQQFKISCGYRLKHLFCRTFVIPLVIPLWYLCDTFSSFGNLQYPKKGPNSAKSPRFRWNFPMPKNWNVIWHRTKSNSLLKIQHKCLEFEETLSTPHLTSGNPMLKGNMKSNHVNFRTSCVFT